MNHSLAFRILIAIVALLMSTTVVHADKTLRGKLKVNPDSVAEKVNKSAVKTVVSDTIVPASQDEIHLSGYDKPLNSRKESLFVSNRLDRSITAVSINLIYKDMNGRTLHEVTREVRAEIPAAGTRRIEFSSWDKQNSFYYHKGRKPRVDNVTPYDVSCTVVYYVSPQQQ